ncbi:hypothetical protein P175DRAFT_0521547 [Aspergillus ochraceoroseus IBT 24754]|uniref:Uncharacterized protein n=3 Tax=Aspergillus subgen. Nidulantes TaxID=2720870 RepID=A0A0F8WB38_9EURO|nr:uncharacterized protein P175DRAFT_0521547 [Aspergillus ochraceoroseus IBT 24754]KKK15070.1 hypothetical protein ARAM_006479 [Aspergillus rambellii]KKK24934.1 hypothetical protein AOCH_003074 [Aspergillus ochraceoroseus]PTU22382.1 hypothetical protein P175DRAFT_0521547 [Aspergillus ochraceoroseus IBT 24754]
MNRTAQTVSALVDRQAIVHAYRHLYRQGLKAINYSTPSRYLLLQTLRSSFRSSPAQDFNQFRITNTLQFLRKAADVSGIEHKIVRNLLQIKYWEQPNVRNDLRVLKGLGIDRRELRLRKDAHEQLNQTVMLLNESLGTCLR